MIPDRAASLGIMRDLGQVSLARDLDISWLLLRYRAVEARVLADPAGLGAAIADLTLLLHSAGAVADILTAAESDTTPADML